MKEPIDWEEIRAIYTSVRKAYGRDLATLDVMKLLVFVFGLSNRHPQWEEFSNLLRDWVQDNGAMLEEFIRRAKPALDQFRREP